MSEAINQVSKKISIELKRCSKTIRNDVYNFGPLDDITEFELSDTLMKLLGDVHKSLSFGPKANLINSVILSCFTQIPTSLQSMMGGYFRHIPVKRFQKLSKYGVTCSYDELKRLRTLQLGIQARICII